MRTGCGGFTTLELMTAAALMVVVMLGVFGTTEVMRTTFNGNDRLAEAHDAVRQALRRVNAVVQPADPSTITARSSTASPWEVPIAGTSYSSLRVQQPGGATVSLEFVLDGNELDNAVDDDGDGLVDEGSLAMADSTSSSGPVALVLGVESCAFSLDGRLAQLILQCARQDQSRRLHRVTRDIKVYLRNG